MEHQDISHHWSRQFNAELEAVRNNVMTMGGMVEEQLRRAVEALVRGDSALGEEVVRDDYKVNNLEVSIDEECSRIIAKRQPTASDLRLVMAVIKTITDLERIGDEAEKIGYLATRLALQERPVDRYRGLRHMGDLVGGMLHQSLDAFARMDPELAMQERPVDRYRGLRHMGDLVGGMLHQSLDAFARMDPELAMQVVEQDKSVDQEYDGLSRQGITLMMEDPRSIRRVLDMLWVARALERIGDHAKNICEYVVYMVHGKDIRHVDIEDAEKHLAEE